MWTSALWNHPTWLLQWGVVIGASLGAAVTDFRYGQIPNWLTVPAWAAGLAWATWANGPVGFADALCGSLVLALPFILLFLFAGGGAGDAKLMGAMGAWLGLTNGLVVLLAVAIAGGVCGMLLALARGQARAVLARLGHMALGLYFLFVARGKLSETRLILRKQTEMLAMPYGIPIFIGVCLAAGGILLWHAQ